MNPQSQTVKKPCCTNRRVARMQETTSKQAKQRQESVLSRNANYLGKSPWSSLEQNVSLIINQSKWEKGISIPTLHDDVRCGMYGINIIGGKAGILSSISLDHVLDIKPSGRGDVDTSIVGQGCPIAFSPRDPRLWLACGTALQGHTLSHQHLSVQRLDHKTWPCLRSSGGEKRGENVGIGLD